MTPDSIESTFATNHLGNFLLTLLLLDTLRAAEAARVIAVGSGAHGNARGDFVREKVPGRSYSWHPPPPPR